MPILPHALLEVLDAPVATIIGMHSSFTSEPEFKRVCIVCVYVCVCACVCMLTVEKVSLTGFIFICSL